MKTLGKILIAAVLVAMIVTSIITVVTAADAYNGDLVTAQTHLNNVVAVDDSDLYGKAVALERVYYYLKSTPVDPESTGYADFEKNLYRESMHLAELYLDKLLGRSDEEKGVYALIAANELAQKLIDEIVALEYAIPENPLFTGTVEGANATLAGLDEDSSFAELKAGLATAYDYLIETPVNPSTDAYVDFISSYNELSDALIERFVASVDESATPEEKIAQLSSFRAYLTDAMISAKVVKAYNDKLEAVKAEYNAGLADAEPLNTLFGGSYSTNLKTVADAMIRVTTYIGQGKYTNASTYLNRAYASLSTTLYDPGAEYTKSGTTYTYYDLLDAYIAASETLLDELFIKKYDAAKGLDDKYSVLLTFYKNNLESMPYAADAYNEKRLELYSFVKDIAANLGGGTVVYNEPAKADPTLNGYVLNSLLGDITDAYDEYVGAEAADKAAAFDKLKSAVSSMIKLLSVSVIDTEASYYEDFVAAYDAARLDFVNTYLSMVDAAEGEAKAGVLSEIKSFFNENPLSKSAIIAYNAKVAEVFAGDEAKITEYQLTSVYFEIEELLDAVSTTATLEENMAAMRTLYAYYLRDYDVTDMAYSEFVSAYNEKDALLGKQIVDALDEVFAQTNAVGVAEVVELATDYLSEVQLKQAISAFKGAADRLVAYANKIVKYVEDGDKLDAGDETLSSSEQSNALRTAVEKFHYDAFAELLEAYDEDASLEEKKLQFKAIHDELSRMRGVWFHSFEWDLSFVELADEYDAICSALSNDIIATMTGATTVFDKFAALEEAKTFVLIVPYSNIASNISEAYDALLETLKSEDFSGFATQVETACPTLAYAAPAGFEDDFTAFEEIGDGNIHDVLVEAYELLAATAQNAKPFNFGNDCFIDIINSFDELKDDISAEFCEDIDFSSYSERIEIFENMHALLYENCMSEKMVDVFNEKRIESINVYTIFNETYLNAELAINHFAKFPVEPSVLDAASAARYAAITAEIDGYIPFVKYEVVKAAIIVFNNAEGDFAVLNQKRALDVMKRYADVDAAVCNEAAFAEKILTDIFKALIKDLDEAAIVECGEYIVENKFPQYLIDVYNATFEKTLTAAQIPEATKTGTLAGLVNFVNRYNDAVDGEEWVTILTDMVNYLNENPIASVSEYNGMTEEIKAAKENYQRIVKAQKTEHLNNANIIDLSFKPTTKMDGSKLTTNGNYFTSGGANLVAKGWSYASEIVEVFNEDGTIKEGAQYENKYVNVATVNAAPYWWQQNGYNSAGGYTYNRGTSGMVIDFDVMAPESLDFKLYIHGVEPTELKRKEASYDVFLASFSGNKLSYQVNTLDPEYSGYKSGVNEQICVTPGEWTHVTAIINANERTVELLINYVSLGTKAIEPQGTLGLFNPELLRYTLLQVCFGETARESGRDQSNNYCYDNVRITRGSSYFDDDMFAAMSTGEKFKYYVSRLVNTDETAANRLYAYMEAATLVDSVSGSEYTDYKAAYNSFKTNELAAVTAETYQHHYDFVEEMHTIYDEVINTENAPYNKIVFDMVNDYLDYQRKYINFSDDKIMAITENIWEIENKFTIVNNTNDLVTTMKQFYRATTLASLEKHFASVSANYAKFGDREAYNLAMQDVAVKTFFATLEKDDAYVKALKEGGVNMTIDLFYSDYAPYRIEKQLKIENTKAIIDCIGFIEALVPSKDGLTEQQYYAMLLEIAEAEVDYVSPYMSAVTAIINSGKYNAETDGVAHALEIFELLEERFYELTQTQHLETIGAQLEKYAKTDSYIEKLGVCAFVESYIVDNNVDMSGAVGVEYLNILAAYKQELDSYKDVYEDIVNQNTKYFIDLVTKMEAYVTYSELKPLYDEGVEKYYYSMNVDSNEAQAAIAKFNAYGKFLEDAEFNSKMFIEHVNTLKSARRQSHIYRALVNCTLYLEGANEDIDGVTEALAIYNEKLAAYNATIGAVNGGISDSTTIVCSLRSTSIGKTILAIIKSIFTN